MQYEHARSAVRIGFPFRISPYVVLITGAMAVDAAKKYFKRLNEGKCPTCGHSPKGYTVKEKPCGHEKHSES